MTYGVELGIFRFFAFLIIADYAKQKLSDLESILAFASGNASLLSGLRLPLFKELVPGNIEYGTKLMVEFEPGALWYETSLTLAAQAARQGVKTVYHVFEHPPDDVRRFLTRIGLDVAKLEEDSILRIMDSFTVQTGLGFPDQKQGSVEPVTQSLKVSDWSLAEGQALKAGIREEDKRWLHVDENTGILLQYNQEKQVIDFFRTRSIPGTRAYEGIHLHPFVKGVASDGFYRQFESLCDGIVDFKNEEKGTEIEHLVRLRSLRGKQHDARWHRLQLQENSEVTMID